MGIREGRVWCCDNEAFTRPFDQERFISYLHKLAAYRETCMFVSIPDRVGNALATLYKWRAFPWWAMVKEMGLPTAFVAQDGQELFGFPPADQWDVLFIGGSTMWKMSQDADACILRAHAIGKRIHVGRVNSVVRMRHFEMIGADSVDGTAAAFEPDVFQNRMERAFTQSVMPLWSVPAGDSGR